ncbi:quercetin dioxygenase-like cupin family protein [Flavobacterium sp. HSC-32F16]|uniref:cupin domain-containing protein n=1 Tax=Flavobacterium sp. HSC-32F16 TaxID=2910964 RepID=UPI0020A35E60|nr:cupin domain-containing protein [Flavobacterium sp. HSC-32F16]MCP2025584.1 quercetin dioxygenase-like cupin family protein [Flavobacterium sp. HSC-32F16]
MSKNYSAVIEEGKVPSTYMTGDVSYKKQSSDIHPENTVIKEVTFEPCSRSNWHSNAGLHLLIAKEGIGYYQERGNAVRMLQKDEVVTILPGVEHWYGATPFEKFSYVAIITEIDKGHGVWLEKVTDGEYFLLSSH